MTAYADRIDCRSTDRQSPEGADVNHAEKEKVIAKAKAERDAAIAAANERYRLRIETIGWANEKNGDPAASHVNGQSHGVTHSKSRRPAAFTGETANRVRSALAAMPSVFTIEHILKHAESQGRAILRDPAMSALKRAVKDGRVERIKIGDAHNLSTYRLTEKGKAGK